MDELWYRGLLYVDVYAPGLIFSSMNHMFNIFNKTKGILVRHGETMDMRLHDMFVIPSGYGKSLFIGQFLRGKHALLVGTKIHSKFVGKITEAGLVGTSRQGPDGETQIIPGIALQYPESIIGAEEFAAISKMGKTTHSKDIDEALLLILDRGYIYKRLASGEVNPNEDVPTHVTLQAGTQVDRFDLTSGIGRRLWFTLFIPGKKERDEIYDASFDAINQGSNVKNLTEIRREVNKRWQEIKNIERVVFDGSIKAFGKSEGIDHNEAELYRRAALGYVLAREAPGKIVTVGMDSLLEKTFKKSVQDRIKISAGTDYIEMIKIVQDEGNEIAMKDLREGMRGFGVDWKMTANVLKDLRQMGILTYDKETRMVVYRE